MVPSHCLQAEFWPLAAYFKALTQHLMMVHIAVQSSVESGRPMTGMALPSCEHQSSRQQPSHSHLARASEPVPLMLRDYLVKMICNGRDGSGAD